MELFDCPDNPQPAGGNVLILTASDGVRLRGAHWPSAVSRHRGTICLVHGRAEFIEKYFEVVHDLQAHGFEIVTLDWRGQGGSERLLSNSRRGHVDDFNDYERDLEALLGYAEEHCRPPFFALGHSTGGAVLLRAAHRLEGRVKRMVMTSPFIDFGTAPIPPAIIYPLSGVLTYCGMGSYFVPGGRSADFVHVPFEDNPLTSDPVRYQRAEHVVTARPDLAIGAPTVGWIYAASRNIRRLARPEFPMSVKVPNLIVTAGADRVVSVRAQEEMAVCLRSGGHVFIPGARHELMMEQDVFRNQFWAVFDAFIPGSHADERAKRDDAKVAKATAN